MGHCCEWGGVGKGEFPCRKGGFKKEVFLTKTAFPKLSLEQSFVVHAHTCTHRGFSHSHHSWPEIVHGSSKRHIYPRTHLSNPKVSDGYPSCCHATADPLCFPALLCTKLDPKYLELSHLCPKKRYKMKEQEQLEALL